MAVTAVSTPAFSAQIGTLLELYKYHRYEHGGGMDLEGQKFSSLVKFFGQSAEKKKVGFHVSLIGKYLPQIVLDMVDALFWCVKLRSDEVARS